MARTTESTDASYRTVFGHGQIETGHAGLDHLLHLAPLAVRCLLETVVDDTWSRRLDNRKCKKRSNNNKKTLITFKNVTKVKNKKTSKKRDSCQ